jgi:hypothetical protein
MSDIDGFADLANKLARAEKLFVHRGTARERARVEKWMRYLAVRPGQDTRFGNLKIEEAKAALEWAEAEQRAAFWAVVSGEIEP